MNKKVTDNEIKSEEIITIKDKSMIKSKAHLTDINSPLNFETMDIAVSATNLSKVYGDNAALNNINLRLNSNELIGLIGTNGSGKTTFMKLIAGLLDKSSGEIKVFGEDPMDNLNVLENVVYTYHDLTLTPELTLKSHLKSYNAMYPNFDMDFATNLMNLFHLKATSKYKNLSQGMMSLFNFICGLSTRAELTMLDEPILGMDVTVRKSAYEILLRDYIEHPRTIIISSHILSEVEDILSEMIIINKGEVLLYDNIDNIRDYAYRVDGSANELAEFTRNKNIIYKSTSQIRSFMIVKDQITENTESEAKSHGLTVSRIRPEELYVYLAGNDYEEGMECLWTTNN